MQRECRRYSPFIIVEKCGTLSSCRTAIAPGAVAVGEDARRQHVPASHNEVMPEASIPIRNVAKRYIVEVHRVAPQKRVVARA
jgi:hypothetical protein